MARHLYVAVAASNSHQCTRVSILLFSLAPPQTQMKTCIFRSRQRVGTNSKCRKHTSENILSPRRIYFFVLLVSHFHSFHAACQAIVLRTSPLVFIAFTACICVKLEIATAGYKGRRFTIYPSTSSFQSDFILQSCLLPTSPLFSFSSLDWLRPHRKGPLQ
ncbi:hypothetical protein CPC08DRAFT_355134 [Agrocybe pediades]|nr:hypothetical protein CPC08DRAFT_355134 [Agrocybe pediades]